MADAIVEIVDEYDPQSMSTRQVYYQCVSRGILANCEASYDKVQRILVELRRDGDIEYDRIVDRRRTKYQLAGWDSAEDIIKACGNQFRRDVWSSQPTVVMIACEKVALEGIFAEAVDEYGASLWTFQGYISESFAFEWATEIRALTDRGRKVAIYYFGDHDPSGLDIERDAIGKLLRHGAVFVWGRKGLLFGDLDRFNLINVPVKAGDTKSKKYLEAHGDRAAELDALPPDELKRRIVECIEKHLDASELRLVQRDEELQRETLALVASRWDAAVAGAKGTT